MNEKMTDIAQATILLCSRLALKKDMKPYTTVQWYKLGSQIMNSSLKSPASLFGLTPEEIMNALYIDLEEAKRIANLMSRGTDVALAICKLEERGIKIVTKSDSEYPQRIKSFLGSKNSPPILFYCGDLSLADTAGISIVGSRNIDPAGEKYASELAKKAVVEGLTIFSGGARGVDDISTNSALKNGGKAVSFLSSDMMNKIRENETMQAIMEGKLLLLSEVSPDAHFIAGNAMSRNKYIYVLSNASFVISSDIKGGTWSGAMENLKKKWVPIYVWQNERYKGNLEIIKKGAIPVNDISNIDFSKIRPKTSNGDNIVEIENYSLFDFYEKDKNFDQLGEEHDNDIKISVSEEKEEKIQEDLYSDDDMEDKFILESENYKEKIYKTILGLMQEYLRTEHTADEMAEDFGIAKGQINSWLKKAVEDKKIKKLNKPVRYCI